jgi:GTPase SAR1 family protein
LKVGSFEVFSPGPLPTSTMGRYATLLTGPAGSGKSTLASALITHAQSSGRTVHLFNLDPAAERFEYSPSIDIKDLISLEDVMSEMNLGPNGGLIYCFEYLMENLDWLSDQLAEYSDDYLIIDCPGQIELYTHTPLLSRFINILMSTYNYRVSACYLLESNFIDDVNKYFAGTLSAMSSMINLEVPMINVLSKVDLLKRGETGNSRGLIGRTGRTGKDLDRFLDPDPTLILSEATSRNPKFHNLNKAIVQLVRTNLEAVIKLS